jgi:hypothetical protein
MDVINIDFARDATRRALLGARADDPVVPDPPPGVLTRARCALARPARRLLGASGRARQPRPACAPRAR